MKEIKAYLQKHKIDEVIRALRHIEGLSGMTILHSSGFGKGWGSGEGEADCNPGILLELYCRDELAEETVTAIEKAAHTGLKGDGKIYVSNIEQAVRISTGERGEKAVWF